MTFRTTEPTPKITGRRLATLLACIALGAPVGCHSPFVDASIVNHSGRDLRLVEVDYPSASFGTETLRSGATFKYRFKILGSGPLKISWTDAAEKEHASQGPDLHEGQEGHLTVELDADSAQWTANLQH